MGSNMAECHPVAFQWVVEAKQNGGKLIHVDPRFTRTSALADRHIPIRAGSDIAFLGGLIRYVLEHQRYFPEYVRSYTNAATIIDEGFLDTEDLDGFFSGWNPKERRYDNSSWQYAGGVIHAAAGQRTAPGALERATVVGGSPPQEDPTLQHPRCVFQLLTRHFERYTPEMVEKVTGVPRAAFWSWLRPYATTRAASAPLHSSTPLVGLSTPPGHSSLGPPPSSNCCSATWAGRGWHFGTSGPRKHPGRYRHRDPIRRASRVHSGSQSG